MSSAKPDSDYTKKICYSKKNGKQLTKNIVFKCSSDPVLLLVSLYSQAVNSKAHEVTIKSRFRYNMLFN